MNANQNPLLNEQWLARAGWWVNHREQIKKIFIGIAMVIEALLLLYSAYVLLDYWVISAGRDKAMFNQLTQFPNYTAANKSFEPKPIPAPAVEVLPHGGSSEHNSVLLKFTNPNPQWIANVLFRMPGDTTDRSVIVLNNDSRYIVISEPTSAAGGTALPNIHRIAWKRIHNLNVFNRQKPNFAVSDVEFLSAAQLSSQYDVGASQVRFTAVNNSATGFWSVDFMVLILNGETPVAATTMTLNNFAAGEQREVTVNLPGSVTSATNVPIVPFVDVSDPSTIMITPGGSTIF